MGFISRKSACKEISSGVIKQTVCSGSRGVFRIITKLLREVSMAKDKKIKKKKFDGTEVEILGETYEDGKPEKAARWRDKLNSREQMLRYLKNGERYWFSDDWYGSERRKTPA